MGCFNYTETINPKHHCYPTFPVTADTIGELYDAVADFTGNPHIKDHVVLTELGICPLALVTDFSIEAWNLYNATDGLKNLKPVEYYGLPAIYVAVCNVLSEEIELCFEIKRKANKGN